MGSLRFACSARRTPLACGGTCVRRAEPTRAAQGQLVSGGHGRRRSPPPRRRRQLSDFAVRPYPVIVSMPRHERLPAYRVLSHLLVMAAVAAVLGIVVAGLAIPFAGIAGIGARNVARTMD